MANKINQSTIRDYILWISNKPQAHLCDLKHKTRYTNPVVADLGATKHHIFFLLQYSKTQENKEQRVKLVFINH